MIGQLRGYYVVIALVCEWMSGMPQSADDPLERMGSHSNRMAIQLITCWSHLCGRGAQVGTGRRLVCPLSILCAQVRLQRGYRLH